MEGPCGQPSQPQGSLNSRPKPFKHVWARLLLRVVRFLCSVLVLVSIQHCCTLSLEMVSNAFQVRLSTIGMYLTPYPEYLRKSDCNIVDAHHLQRLETHQNRCGELEYYRACGNVINPTQMR